jgi:signal transduction histidine kinase
MSQRHEFMSDAFHALAQPITALQSTLELGLRKPPGTGASHQVLEDCLELTHRLMQDLAVVREIVNLDETPPREPCDGQALLHTCVEEMALVALERGTSLRLAAEAAIIECNESMFQRAMFVLLDETIGSAPAGQEISISFRKAMDGLALEIRPGIPIGQRHGLCRKLLEFAGGREIHSDSDGTSMNFSGRLFLSAASEDHLNCISDF